MASLSNVRWSLICLSLAGLLAVPAPADDWPMFGRDGSRNAVSRERNPPLRWQVEKRSSGFVVQPGWNIRWEAELGSGNFAPPIVAGGLVWVGTNNARPRDPKAQGDAAVLMCFRESDGKFLWQYVSPRLASRGQDWAYAGINCSPLAEGDRLWFTTNRAEVVCLDTGPLRQGKDEPRLVWKLDMRKELGVWPRGQGMGPGYTCSIAAPYKGRIYVTTGNGIGEDRATVPAPEAPSLLCLDKDIGRVVWLDNSPGKNILHAQWSSPLVLEVGGAGQVIAAQGDGWLRSFDAASGKPIWQFDCNPKRSKWVPGGRGDRNTLIGTPVAYQGRVYICVGREAEDGEGRGRLWCVDPTKRGDVSPELVVDAKGQAVPHRRLQAASDDDRVIANPNSAVVWHYTQHDLNGNGKAEFDEEFHRSVGTPVIKDDILYLADFSGLFHCVDAKTGKPHWTYDLLAACWSSALVVDDKVFIPDEDGDVAAFNHSSDKNKAMKKVAGEYAPVEEINMDTSIGSSPIFANGVLYVATRWKLYAIQRGPEGEAADRPPGHWPQWRGPERSNIAAEAGLLKEWPKEGPPLIWKSAGLGEGVPSVAVAGGRVFVLGYRDEKEYLTVLDERHGRRLWSQLLGPGVKERGSMRYLSQRTPTVDDDRVYAFTAHGALVCLETATGKERWRKDYVKDFEGRPGPWGYCDFPLVDGDKLVCTPGGKEATVLALDKRTGELIWKCAVPQTARATHGAGVAAQIAGVRQFVHQLDSGVVGISLADGKLLWQFAPFGDPRGNVHTAIVAGDQVFASCGWGVGYALLKITRGKDGFAVETIYRSKTFLESWLGSSVLLGDYVHTADGKCIELKSGNVVARIGDKGTGRSTLVCADGRLYHRSHDNVLTLTEVTPKGEYVKKGEFQAPLHSTDPTWTFPVIAGRRLYLRHHDVLLCYDLQEPKRRERGPDAIFVPTPQDVVEKMLALAEVKKEDVMADLGCGDGRIVVTAAKKYGCRAIGYDLDEECVRMSRAAARKAGLDRLVTIEQADLFDVDLRGVSVVTLYLGPKLNARLIPQLEKMKPGSRIVSHEFDMPGIKPDKVVSVTSGEDGVERKLYLWTVPLKKEPQGKAAEAAAEKLLLGFEDEDLTRLSKDIKIVRKEGTTRRGEPYVAWEAPGGFAQLGQWMIHKRSASPADHALGIGLVTNQDYITYSPTKFAIPPEAVAYYGLLNNNWASSGAMFNTCGVFRRIFPVDWSDYDVLRLDAYGEEVKQTVRIVLEDEEISPPIVRNIGIEPGKWVTLEVDLRAAASERGLDLKRMASLAIGVSELQEKLKKERPYTALIDNLRLASEKTPARLPLARDTSAHKLPEYYRAGSRPQARKPPEGKPDHSPLKLDKPFLISTEKTANVAPVGWAAAYDNQRLLLGFDGGQGRNGSTTIFLLQSLDGGRSWRGLGGEHKPSSLYLFNPDHASGRGDVVGPGTDVLLFNNLGCAGANIASLRLFARKLTLTDRGWQLRETPTLVDCDLRHCNSNHSIVRAADGRLWAAYGFVGRLGTNSINVRYSDDDGVSWKGWDENKSVLPGSIHSEKQGIGFGYTFEEPCLVPFGKGVACIWQERQGYDFTRLLWTHFDGKAWSPIEEIEQPKRTVSSPITRPPIHAVSTGGKAIFLVSALWGGVLRYADGAWKAEPVEIPAGSRISAAGDKTIVVIAGAATAPNKGPVVLRSWQRSAGGRWSGPVELAREETPLSHQHDGIYVIRPGLVVQPYAPPNFVPMAWTCEGQKWVKFLRVPVHDP